MKRALVILAKGFEEIEALVPVDLMRRAGIEVEVLTIERDLEVAGKTGLVVRADGYLASADESYDLVMLPGGPGHEALKKSERVQKRIREQVEAGRLLGAICAAPTVLASAGLLEGRRYTAHQSVADQLKEIEEDQEVVEDGPIITSRGAGTAMAFGLKLIERLVSEEKAEAIAREVHFFHHGDTASLKV